MRKLDPFVMRLFYPLVCALGKVGIRPNHLTVVGALLNLVGVYYIAIGNFKEGMVVVIFTWLFDVIDGALAKYASMSTKFGGFLDSVLDRYTEGLVISAFAYAYAVKGNPKGVLYCVIAMLGALTVPYARARAEKEIEKCAIGIGDRLSRLVLLSIFTLLNKAEIGIIFVAVISHFTVFQRILYTRKILKKINRRTNEK